MCHDVGRKIGCRKGRGVAGVHRGRAKSVADVLAPASNWGGLGAWLEWKWEGNEIWRGGLLIGVAKREFRLLEDAD